MLILAPAFWKVAIRESYSGVETELTNVYFSEDRHYEAREYVYRMGLKDYFDSPYALTVSDPILVDELDVTDYNGGEYLDYIRTKQGD